MEELPSECALGAKRRLRGAFVLLQTFLTGCLQPLCMSGLFMSPADAAVRTPGALNQPEICHRPLPLPASTEWFRFNDSVCTLCFNFSKHIYFFDVVVIQLLTPPPHTHTHLSVSIVMSPELNALSFVGFSFSSMTLLFLGFD